MGFYLSVLLADNNPSDLTDLLPLLVTEEKRIDRHNNNTWWSSTADPKLIIVQWADAYFYKFFFKLKKHDLNLL